MTNSHILKMRQGCLGKRSSLYMAHSCVLKCFPELKEVRLRRDIGSGVA